MSFTMTPTPGNVEKHPAPRREFAMVPILALLDAAHARHSDQGIAGLRIVDVDPGKGRLAALEPFGNGKAGRLHRSVGSSGRVMQVNRDSCKMDVRRCLQAVFDGGRPVPVGSVEETSPSSTLCRPGRAHSPRRMQVPLPSSISRVAHRMRVP